MTATTPAPTRDRPFLGRSAEAAAMLAALFRSDALESLTSAHGSSTTLAPRAKPHAQSQGFIRSVWEALNTSRIVSILSPVLNC